MSYKGISGLYGYGLAVAACLVAAAFALPLTLAGIHGPEFPIVLMAIAITVWYTSRGPSITGLLLNCLSFNYFFTPPVYTFYISAKEVPDYIAFVLFALLLAGFTEARRKAEFGLLRSQEALRQEVVVRTRQARLLDLTHDTIFVRDSNEVITYWNRGAQELFGWTAEEAVGKRAGELLKTELPVSNDEIQAELQRTGRWQGEISRTRADGTRLVVASRWSLHRDESSGAQTLLETNNDVTERRKREDEIRALNTQLAKRTGDLEAINKELEAFAYTISHDLRAPLRHMVGFTELLQKHSQGTLDEKSRRYVAIILEAAKRMGKLVDDLLAFSRIGRTETHKTIVSLQQLVQEAVAEMEPEITEREVAWRIGKLPPTFGDRSMLRLALVNLISNALKFTRTRPRTEIEIDCTEQSDSRVVLFVRDNGVGFDMKYHSKLFGVFQRLHSQDEFEGTGIGLATVRRIVHRHGGTVWAESALDRGATFFLSLSASVGV
jgi:PAS domain S-box-containing protein